MRHPDWQFWRHSKWRLLKWVVGLMTLGLLTSWWIGFGESCDMAFYVMAIACAIPMVTKFHRDMQAAKNNYFPGEDTAWYDHSIDAPSTSQHVDGIFNPGHGPNDPH